MQGEQTGRRSPEINYKNFPELTLLRMNALHFLFADDGLDQNRAQAQVLLSQIIEYLTRENRREVLREVQENESSDAQFSWILVDGQRKVVLAALISEIEGFAVQLNLDETNALPNQTAKIIQKVRSAFQGSNPREKGVHASIKVEASPAANDAPDAVIEILSASFGKEVVIEKIKSRVLQEVFEILARKVRTKLNGPRLLEDIANSSDALGKKIVRLFEFLPPMANVIEFRAGLEQLPVSLEFTRTEQILIDGEVCSFDVTMSLAISARVLLTQGSVAVTDHRQLNITVAPSSELDAAAYEKPLLQCLSEVTGIPVVVLKSKFKN